MTQPPSRSSADTDGTGIPAARARTAEALATAALSKDSLFSQVARLVAAFWASRERNQLLLLAAGLVVVVAATAYMQIRLNAWNRPFYDALTHKDIPEVIAQLRVFAELALILLALNVTQVWLNQTSRVVLRQGLVHDLLNEWLKPMRAFRLSNAGLIGQNPDQRLHADAQHLTDLMTTSGSDCCSRHCSSCLSSVCYGCRRNTCSCPLPAIATMCPATWCGARCSTPVRHRS